MANWTFLTHHAHVLVAVSQGTDLTIDQIASQVGITSRSTAGILADLIEAGYVVKEKVGRNNHYIVNGNIPLRHPQNENANAAELLALFH
jgi:transcription initiation factor IIE alpha subunit